MLTIDKLHHFIAGFVIALIVTFVFQNPMVGLFATLLGAVGKEIYDALVNWLRARKGLPKNHDVDPMDFAFTVYGGMIALIIYMIVGRIYNV